MSMMTSHVHVINKPSSASAQIPMLCGVDEGNTRLPSKDRTRLSIRILARSAISAHSGWKLSCCMESVQSLVTKICESAYPFLHHGPDICATVRIERVWFPNDFQLDSLWTTSLAHRRAFLPFHVQLDAPRDRCHLVV